MCRPQSFWQGKMITLDLNARPSKVLVPLTCGRDNCDFIFTKLATACNDSTLVISVCKRWDKLKYGRFINIMVSLMLTIPVFGFDMAFVALRFEFCVLRDVRYFAGDS
jgi:hypothetical protein